MGISENDIIDRVRHVLDDAGWEICQVQVDGDVDLIARKGDRQQRCLSVYSAGVLSRAAYFLYNETEH